MRLLISGSRGWHDEGAVLAIVSHYQQAAHNQGEEFILIHGHARSGADALADRVGRTLGLKVGEDLIRVPADWDRHGRAAGPIRNQQMLDEHAPDLLVAFRSTGKSNGTDHMIRIARAAGITTHVIDDAVRASRVAR